MKPFMRNGDYIMQDRKISSPPVNSDSISHSDFANRISTEASENSIYDYFLNLVKEESSDLVCIEFKRIFIYGSECRDAKVLSSIYEIIAANNEGRFKHTLKRTCYILINNWEIDRQHSAMQDLVNIFRDPIISKPALSIPNHRLRGWLNSFIESRDYQQLCAFVHRHDPQDAEALAWEKRYEAYQLMAQSMDLNNPVEQQEVAYTRAVKLKQQFRFDLAMYIAKSQTPSKLEYDIVKNPTGMGDEVFRLVKLITLRRGAFSYENLANIFLKQTAEIRFSSFKESLLKYLKFGLPQVPFVEKSMFDLEKNLALIYSDYDDRPLDDALLLRTCNRIIDLMTMENFQQPSTIFYLLSEHHPFALITILLKIYLVCRNTASHLEAKIGQLIQFYSEQVDEDLQRPVNFFDAFNVVFTIHSGNIEYSLINSRASNPNAGVGNVEQLQHYHIFSRLKESA